MLSGNLVGKVAGVVDVCAVVVVSCCVLLLYLFLFLLLESIVVCFCYCFFYCSWVLFIVHHVLRPSLLAPMVPACNIHIYISHRGTMHVPFQLLDVNGG